MSEPTLIQEQRAILRRLRQTTAQHVQLTTAADAKKYGLAACPCYANRTSVPDHRWDKAKCEMIARCV